MGSFLFGPRVANTTFKEQVGVGLGGLIVALFFGPASLPRSSSSPDGQAPPPLLDFGDEVVLRTEVTLQVAITNHSAIAAPFSVQARYFKAHTPASPTGSNSQSQDG